MGGRERVGHLRDQLEPRGERHLLEAALTLRPVHQAAALGVLGIEEVRRLVDVPVEDARDVDPITERLLEEPEKRDLTLESADAVGLEAELEDPRLADGLVPGEPHLAEAALAELPLQL